MVRIPFSVENDWFSGQCDVLTYEQDELVGTKVRASTYKEFVLNKDGKMHNPEFLGDTTDLLRPGLTFDPQSDWKMVLD